MAWTTTLVLLSLGASVAADLFRYEHMSQISQRRFKRGVGEEVQHDQSSALPRQSLLEETSDALLKDRLRKLEERLPLMEIVHGSAQHDGIPRWSAKTVQLLNALPTLLTIMIIGLCLAAPSKAAQVSQKGFSRLAFFISLVVHPFWRTDDL